MKTRAVAEVTPLLMEAASAVIIKNWRQRRPLLPQIEQKSDYCFPKSDVTGKIFQKNTYICSTSPTHTQFYSISHYGVGYAVIISTLSGLLTPTKVYLSLMLHVQYRSAKGLVYHSHSGTEADGGSKLGRVFHCHHIKKGDVVNLALARNTSTQN